MKRLISAVLACLLLAGCSFSIGRLRDPVTFYYLQDDYQKDMSSPIGSEQREASGHRQELSYLLALYMMGPSKKDLSSPLPSGTQALSVSIEGSTLHLALSDTSDTLSEAEYSLACACLSMTFLELTEAEQVTVTSGTRSVTMTRENLSYIDTVTATEETEETQ